MKQLTCRDCGNSFPVNEMTARALEENPQIPRRCNSCFLSPSRPVAANDADYDDDGGGLMA